jgi:hypothetical protein
MILILIAILAILASVSLCYQITTGFLSRSKDLIVTVAIQPVPCTPSLADLPDLDALNIPCCIQNGQETNLRYYPSALSASVPVSVSSIPVAGGNAVRSTIYETLTASPGAVLAPSSNPLPPATACLGYCANGTVDAEAGTCTSSLESERINFEICMTALVPTDCTGSVNPVAYANITYYYVAQIGNIDCQSTKVCSQLIQT